MPLLFIGATHRMTILDETLAAALQAAACAIEEKLIGALEKVSFVRTEKWEISAEVRMSRMLGH